MIVPNKFSIRVYGILFNRQQEVLVAHEQIENTAFTKFPGGGLEFGEGLHDCIIREFKEETGVAVEVLSHIYTSELFIQNSFDAHEQIIGVYYLLAPVNHDDLKKISTEPKQHPFRNTHNTIRLRWVHYKVLSDKILTFSMDRSALEALRKVVK